MIHEKGTNAERAAKEIVRRFVKEYFNEGSNKKTFGGKELKVVWGSENEPGSPYIRLTNLGGRPPYGMGDGRVSFFEHEVILMLDARIPSTDSKAADNKAGSFKINNPTTGKSSVATDSGDFLDDVVFFVKQLPEIPEWRIKISEMGMSNITLVDERENLMGTEYQNPLKLTCNIYVAQ